MVVAVLPVCGFFGVAVVAVPSVGIDFHHLLHGDGIAVVGGLLEPVGGTALVFWNTVADEILHGEQCLRMGVTAHGAHDVVLDGAVGVSRDAVSFIVDEADVGIGSLTAVFGGLAVVVQGFFVILRDAGAAGIVIAHFFFCISKSLFCGQKEPFCGFMVILRNASADFIHKPQIELSTTESCICRLSIPAERFLNVNGNALSFIVHVADTVHHSRIVSDVRLHVAGHGFAVFGGIVEAVACFRLVGPDGQWQEAECKPVQGSGKSHGYQVVERNRSIMDGRVPDGQDNPYSSIGKVLIIFA